MKFTLPIPPSINAMYRRKTYGYGLYKTAEARLWIVEAKKIILKDRKKTILGKVDIDAFFYFARDRDIDSSLKSLLDVLQEAKVYKNDSQVYSLLVQKQKDKDNPRVELEILENR